jgi:hypothetical protein
MQRKMVQLHKKPDCATAITVLPHIRQLETLDPGRL